MSVRKREGGGREGGEEEGKNIFQKTKSEFRKWFSNRKKTGFSKSGILGPKMLETRDIRKNENSANRKTGFSKPRNRYFLKCWKSGYDDMVASSKTKNRMFGICRGSSVDFFYCQKKRSADQR